MAVQTWETAWGLTARRDDFCLRLNQTLYMAGVYICIFSQLSLADVQVGR